jgi:hypothetical protein
LATALLVVANPHDVEASPIAHDDVSTTTTSPDRLTRIKAKSAQAVSDRVDTLKMLRGRVGAASNLTAAHRVALDAELDSLMTSLRSTNDKVQADTDVVSAARDAATIVTDHRVYVLEVPKVHLSIASDDVVAMADKLDLLSSSAQQGFDALQAAGTDTTAARQKIVGIQPKIDALRNSAQAQSNAVLALDATGYPGNKATLQDARNSLNAAKDTVKSIRAEVKSASALVR